MTEVSDDCARVVLLAIVVCAVGEVVDVNEEEMADELNSRTLMFKKSATHRLPDESKVGYGQLSPFCLVDGVLVVKSFWPITRAEPMPVLKGGSNSRTLLFPQSPTQRFPAESKVTESTASPLPPRYNECFVGGDAAIKDSVVTGVSHPEVARRIEGKPIGGIQPGLCFCYFAGREVGLTYY